MEVKKDKDKYELYDYLIYLIKYDKFFDRTIATLIQSPKLFLSAFFWMLGADLANYLGYDERSGLYDFFAGLGDSIGVIIGGLLILFLFQYKGKEFDSELHSTLHISICSGLVAGSLWQITISKYYYY